MKFLLLLLSTSCVSFTHASIEFETKTSGKCNNYVTSMSECNRAAKVLGFSDTTSTNDYNGHVSYDPRGCYYEGGSLKFNSEMTNTGSCSTSDQCLCRKSSGSNSVFCDINHDGSHHPCNADRSDYCCDCKCTYCGPQEFCNKHSPFKKHCGVCNPVYNGAALCMNHYELCSSINKK